MNDRTQTTKKAQRGRGAVPEAERRVFVKRLYDVTVLKHY